jgi:hypothetical protein
MKISEFEDKLATVPEVAVKLILNECKRRGMDDLDVPSEGASDASPDSDKPAFRQGAAEAEGLDSGAPATAPDWLNEETNKGMPVAAKVLMLIIALGAILGLAWKFTR